MEWGSLDRMNPTSVCPSDQPGVAFSNVTTTDQLLTMTKSLDTRTKLEGDGSLSTNVADVQPLLSQDGPYTCQFWQLCPISGHVCPFSGHICPS